MIQQGWHEQYDRMRRSYRALAEHATTGHDSDIARDALFHFFQDAYHLKDWIKNDPRLSSDSEAAVRASEELQLCADRCNATKHFVLTTTRTGDFDTGFDSQSGLEPPRRRAGSKRVSAPGVALARRRGASRPPR